MTSSEFIYKLQRIVGRVLPQRKLGIKPAANVKPRGRALVSYLPLPAWGDPELFRGHSNVWESSEIVKIFNRNGYIVDLIPWYDKSFLPKHSYSIVFDIYRNLLRYADDTSKAILHVTGSSPTFSNQAEEERLRAISERRKIVLASRRFLNERDLPEFNSNMVRADIITLIGNTTTTATFDPNIRKKIRQVVATGSWLPTEIAHRPLALSRKEFLWFNGAGAVHKGLDLVLEVFARNPQLVLHVVGPYLKERDFVAAYRKELFDSPNIRSHGFLYPAGRHFQEIVSRAAAFISPSCSEGISTASITCMQCGVIPILSANCGITLPKNCGYILGDCSLESIEETVLLVAGNTEIKNKEIAMSVRNYAWETYSRGRFSRLMEDAIVSEICNI